MSILEETGSLTYRYYEYAVSIKVAYRDYDLIVGVITIYGAATIMVTRETENWTQKT